MTAIVQTQSEPRVQNLYREILSKSFPRAELCTEAELVDSVAAGHYRAWVLERAGTDGGVAIVEDVGVPGLALLSWLAMQRGGRSAGGGTRLLRSVLAAEAANGVTHLVGEIENPAGDASHAHGDPSARARFYERFGAQAIVVPYDQPPMAPGLPAVPMLLLAIPTKPHSDQPIPATALTDLLVRSGRVVAGSLRHTAIVELLADGVPRGSLTAATFVRTRERA